jgi:HAD superfamily hydrolase (TIGR01509 family)
MDVVDLTRVTALFFDFDGTLLDTESTAEAAWRRLFRAHGAEFPESLHRSLLGRPDSQAALLAVLVAAVPGADPGPTLNAWRADVHDLAALLPARDGVLDVLLVARERDWTLAVTSGATREWVVGHLHRLALLDLFDVVITGEGRPAKPDPGIYQEALSRCRVRPRQVIAFEDSPPGLAAARAAGITCVRVGDPDPAAPEGAGNPFPAFAVRLTRPTGLPRTEQGGPPPRLRTAPPRGAGDDRSPPRSVRRTPGA